MINSKNEVILTTRDIKQSIPEKIVIISLIKKKIAKYHRGMEIEIRVKF